MQAFNNAHCLNPLGEERLYTVINEKRLLTLAIKGIRVLKNSTN